jgi:hypothetical protein
MHTGVCSTNFLPQQNNTRQPRFKNQSLTNLLMFCQNIVYLSLPGVNNCYTRVWGTPRATHSVHFEIKDLSNFVFDDMLSFDILHFISTFYISFQIQVTRYIGTFHTLTNTSREYHSLASKHRWAKTTKKLTVRTWLPKYNGSSNKTQNMKYNHYKILLP